MDSRQKYKLADAKQRRRLKAFSDCVDPADIASDLALTRHLIERAVQSGSIGLAGGLLATLGRLSGAHTANEIRKDNLLSKSVVGQLARAIVATLADELRQRQVDDWEDIVDAVATKILGLIRGATNQAPLLEGPKE